MILGIFLGLIAATLQSSAYVASRVYLHRHQSSSLNLMAISHIIMGALSAVILPFIWPDDPPAWSDLLLPVLGMSICYIIAQTALFLSLKFTAASRAAPLLSLKVFILALLSLLVWGEMLSLLQWGAVFFSILAAFILNGSGGSMAGKSIAGVMTACFCYALSDVSIRALVLEFAESGLFYASVLTVCLNYTFCGIVAVAAIRYLPARTPKMWMDTLPFSITWFFAMFFLFACFGTIGVVFGNIVQSSRGIISILMGWLISHLGHVHVEEKVESGVLTRRIFAGILMAAAIALFYVEA